MADPFLIVCAAVAAVILIMVTASMFGVSRRAVEAEMRAAELDVAEDGAEDGRDNLAA